MISEKIKLRLCRRYNIVVLEEDEFKFAKYRQKAKDNIRKKTKRSRLKRHICNIDTDKFFSYYSYTYLSIKNYLFLKKGKKKAPGTRSFHNKNRTIILFFE